MIDINEYIIEKLHLNKDTESRCYDLNSWIEYIETIGGSVFEMNKGVYIICLSKSTKLEKNFNQNIEYTYPYIEIETIDDDVAWEPYDRADGEMCFHKDKINGISCSEKELDKYTGNSWRKSVYKFSEKNAEFIMNKLNELY